MSKNKKHKPHEEEMGEAWLLPYSDLMTLLLAVFIVLFAVSQVDKEKTKAMSEQFGERMMTESYVESKRIPDEQNLDEEEAAFVEEIDQMTKLKIELDNLLKAEQMTGLVATKIDDRGLVVSLNNAFFFESGSAEIKLEYREPLLSIASVIGTMKKHIRIEGHTDNVPMNSELYLSNWDLSAARAASVVRMLTTYSNIPPEMFLAVGYGEYRPIADNDTEVGRAKNRRIDIIVMSDKYDALEESLAN
ncbi:MAG: flagellar motor protein MotB [Eubacteriales bacterium]|nr:flagellar motor protein MotB [Eubacteriales bacterium]